MEHVRKGETTVGIVNQPRRRKRRAAEACEAAMPIVLRHGVNTLDDIETQKAQNVILQKNARKRKKSHKGRKEISLSDKEDEDAKDANESDDAIF